MKIALVMGSDSDLKIMQEAIDTLKSFSISCDVFILSAHRTPQETLEFARKSREEGYEVIIAAAGMAAHLPGFIAANTTLPVIGVPIASTLNGLDALLSICQMPPGIPVATMAINGAKNAALFAVEILALKYESLQKKLLEYREEMRKKVIEKNQPKP